MFLKACSSCKVRFTTANFENCTKCRYDSRYCYVSSSINKTIKKETDKNSERFIIKYSDCNIITVFVFINMIVDSGIDYIANCKLKCKKLDICMKSNKIVFNCEY